MFPSLKQLLTSIVDYAGLFPPAQLSLPEAVAIYDRARSSTNCWMLDRFVLPAARLSELINLLPDTGKTHSSNYSSNHLPNRWSLSVILSHNWAAELEPIYQLGASSDYPHPIEISALEIVPLSPNDILQVCDRLFPGIPAFFEIPFDMDLEPYLKVLRQTGAAAKLRTGGVTSAAFPDSTQLSQRILSLATAQIPFKATAGLHHPLRGNHRLTYQPHSPTTTMHGFLNVAILAAFACTERISCDEAIAILEAASLDSFQFTDTELHWRDRSLSLDAIRHARQHCFRSFGSCSFQEPIDDLQQLGLIEK